MPEKVPACFNRRNRRAPSATRQWLSAEIINAETAKHRSRRLIVLDRNNELVGIVSLGNLDVKTGDDEKSGEVLERIREPAHAG